MTRPFTARLRSRKFLLALFGQVTGLALLLFPEHAGEIEAAATNIGALTLMALTATGWIASEAYVDREGVAGDASDRQRHEHMDFEREREHRRVEFEMEKLRHAHAHAWPVMLALLLAASAAAGGCAATPEDRWYQAQDMLTTARTAILAHHAAGNLSDAELVRLDEFEKTARTALAAAEALATDPGAGDQVDLIWHLELAEQVLERLIDYLGHHDNLGNPGNPQGPATPTHGATDDDRSGNPEIGAPGQRDPDHRPRVARVGAPPGGPLAAGRPAHRLAA